MDATRIRATRETLRFERADLARLLNVSERTVTRWERGEAQPDEWQRAFLRLAERATKTYAVEHAAERLAKKGPVSTLIYLSLAVQMEDWLRCGVKR